jgi:hypothetical protein
MFYVPQLILSRFAVRKISVYADVSIHRQFFGHLLSHRARRRPRNQVVVVLEVREWLRSATNGLRIASDIC